MVAGLLTCPGEIHILMFCSADREIINVIDFYKAEVRAAGLRLILGVGYAHRLCFGAAIGLKRVRVLDIWDA